MSTLPKLLLPMLLFILACEKNDTGLQSDLHLKAIINTSEWIATDIYASYSKEKGRMLIFGSKRATQQLPEERLQFSFSTPRLLDSLKIELFESSLEIIVNGTEVTTKYELLDEDTLGNSLYITEFDTLNHIIEGHFNITFNQVEPRPGERQPLRFSDGDFKIRYELE